MPRVIIEYPNHDRRYATFNKDDTEIRFKIKGISYTPEQLKKDRVVAVTNNENAQDLFKSLGIPVRGTRKQTTICLSVLPSTLERLKNARIHTTRSVSDLAHEAIIAWLDAHNF